MTTSLPAPTDAQARAIEASAGAIREAVQALRGLGGYLERVFGTVPEDLVGYFGGDRLTSLFVTDPDWEIGNKGRWSIECAVPPSVLAQLETDLLVERACAGRSEFCTTG